MSRDDPDRRPNPVPVPAAAADEARLAAGGPADGAADGGGADSQQTDTNAPVATVDVASLLDAHGGAAGRLIDILGGDARFVGGCVRDLVLGQPGEDIDIATPLEPADVVGRLSEAGWKTVPVGIEHGTILAVAPEARGTFEVTTLRRDIETDGRHATVAFTTDWREDAARRDFTYNAMSLDRDGYLYDHFGGLEDLESGHTRFVGSAADRIREDRLRILRAFRFHARYGLRDLDGDTLQALSDQAHGLAALSGERIRQEMARLIVGPKVLQTLRIMEDCGVLAQALSLSSRSPGGATRADSPDFAQLERLMVLEEVHDEPGLWRRFAAVLGRGEARIRTLADRYRLSNQDRDRLLRLSGRRPARAMNWMLYLDGPETALDRLLLDAAELNQPVSQEHVQLIRDFYPVPLPVSGQDVVDLGVEPGPRVGLLVKRIEAWWVDRNFEPSRADCLWELAHQARAGFDDGEK